MLMSRLLYFTLKVADLSLSESGHLVPYGLTSHTLGIKEVLTAYRRQAVLAYHIALFEKYA